MDFVRQSFTFRFIHLVFEDWLMGYGYDEIEIPWKFSLGLRIPIKMAGY
jgi:hypothetical protein